ncbi:cytochrome P450 [Streptomyces hygroscopicus subsp. sporocinereus]|uniref:Cytochrome P450 n=1 Tax=Streptomyces hygroscopicus TaxID=1912 RepID=A0ABQ3UBQ8_STRHY|nr:cytochrome P450 [Streptomyces hygroscopicus]
MTPPPDDFGTGPAGPAPARCPVHPAPSGSGPVDLLGPENEKDPMGLYERLRAEHGAVAPIVLDGDVPAWLLLGYRENLEVSRTPSRFSRDSRHWHAWKDGRITADSPLLPVVGWQPMCTFADGAEHERLRAALTESMGRFDRRGIRRHVTRFTHQLVNDFCADGGAELVTAFAQRLPMLVLTHLLGMPDEYGPRLVESTRDLMKGTETALRSDAHVTEALQGLVERRRASPGEDLASWLLAHPSGLTEEEVVQHLRLVLLTGNETTTNLMANTLRMVLTDPRFRATLAGGQMTLPDAIEHVLWNEPPLTVVPGRWATGDTELGGQQIKAGDMLLLGLAAGNVDPAIRPDIAAPMYGNRSHLAFSGGPHECPGQDIGRAITDTAIDTLLLRLPDLRLAVDESELTWLSSWISRHLVALPVEFMPRRAEPGLVADPAAATPSPRPRAPRTPEAEPAPAPCRAAEEPAPAPRRTAEEPAAPAPGRVPWWVALWRRLLGRPSGSAP